MASLARQVNEMPFGMALALLGDLEPSTPDEALEIQHALGWVYNIEARREGNDSLFSVALNHDWTGVQIAQHTRCESRFAALNALAFVRDAGHTGHNIDHLLHPLRSVVLLTDQKDLMGHGWWRNLYWYNLNLRRLRAALTCLRQYVGYPDHDPEEAELMRVHYNVWLGDADLSEVAALDCEESRLNLAFMSRRDWQPVGVVVPDESKRGRTARDRVLGGYLDVTANLLDVLRDTGDVRVAQALTILREANRVLDEEMR